LLLQLLVLFAASPPGHGNTDDFAPRVPMAFAHADHHERNCIACHHNFADTSGQGLCIDCHVRDAALRAHLEAQFHALCRGCHVDLRRQREASGSVRPCRSCHHREDLP